MAGKTKKKRVFTKKITCETAAQKEYVRSREIYQKVQESQLRYLRIARPLRIEGKVVYFEKITQGVELRNLTLQYRMDCNLLFRVGAALAEFHRVMNPSMASLDQAIVIHGDFWGANVLCSNVDESVYIVDFAPPHFVDDHACCSGVAYDDIAQMIIGLQYKYPLWKPYLLLRKNNRKMVHAFLRGYESVMGVPIDPCLLREYVVQWLRTYAVVFSKKNIVSRKVWPWIFRRGIANLEAKEGDCMKKNRPTDYRQSHVTEDKAENYEFNVYAENSASNSLWCAERVYLQTLLSRLIKTNGRYMDFACGTGRIVSFIAPHFDYALGVDVSESMLAIARTKGIDAELLSVDLTREPERAGGHYDLITAFRFFVNAQPSLRREVILVLSTKLADEGILVFNIHTSRPSFLWLQNKIVTFLKRKKQLSMSRGQVVQLVKEVGLEITEIQAFGVIPKALHLVLGPRIWRWLDQQLCKLKTFQRIGSDVIYVCMKKQSSN